MKSSRSKSNSVWLLALTFLVGVGSTSAVYWLFIAPSNSQTTNVVVQIPGDESGNAATRENVATNESLSSTEPRVDTVRNLDDLDEVKGAFKRDLALRQLLADSNETQVVELFAQSQELSSSSQGEVQMAIVQRLAYLNPKLALSSVLELNPQYYPGQFVSSIFREWAHSDLDEAIAHVRTIDEDWKDSAVRSILHERKDLSESTIRAIARDLGSERIAIGIITERNLKDAMEDPEKAWNELAIELQDDFEHRWSIARVATAWVEKSGMSVLDQIDRSLTNADARQLVISQVLQSVAVTDPRSAFKYALNMDQDQWNSITLDVAGVWARSDPQSALAAASEIEKSSLRSRWEDMVAVTWADKRPHEVVNGIDALPAHVWPHAIGTAMFKISRDSPKEAASLVASLESEVTKSAAASSVAIAWIHQDHKATLDWILNEPAIEELKPRLLGEIMFALVGIDPELAMNTALAQPIEEDETGMGRSLEFSVISSLAYSNVDKAVEFLPMVRQGPAKLRSYKAVMRGLIHEGDVDEAFGLVQQVPESDRTDCYMTLASAWANSDPEGVLNSMSRLPSKEVKSRAASVLVSNNRYHKRLTDEQIGKAREFLTDDDAKSLEGEEAQTY